MCAKTQRFKEHVGHVVDQGKLGGGSRDQIMTLFVWYTCYDAKEDSSQSTLAGRSFSVVPVSPTSLEFLKKIHFY